MVASRNPRPDEEGIATRFFTSSNTLLCLNPVEIRDLMKKGLRLLPMFVRRPTVPMLSRNPRPDESFLGFKIREMMG
jgi:hypothetical protein